MSFCKKCGYQLVDGEAFCKGCGAPIARSYWDGGIFETFLNGLIAGLICTVTFGIATPWAICYLLKFVVERTVVDGKRLTFNGTGGQLFGKWLLWNVLSFITLGIYGMFWATPRMYQWVVSHIHAEE